MGRARSNPTSRRDLLKEAGYTHLLDWPLDDQPRPVRGAAGAVAATGACACSNAARCRRSDISRSFDSSGSPRAPTAGGGQGGKDRRSATRLIPPFRMIRRPSRRPCSRGTFRAWSYTSPRRYSVCHRALILGRGAKECHSVMVPGGDAPFLDIMTVQDLRLEIRRDGTATAAIQSGGCGLLYSGHELS